jgi:cell division protein FtsW
MTCVAMGLLLRVSYELERAQRQVALRGEAMQASAEPHTEAETKASSPNISAPSATAVSNPVRGTSRLRPRVEPTFERIA